MTRMTNVNLPKKRLTISLARTTHQRPRVTVPPPTPYPWVWRCHRCHGGRRFTASNRCLGCSHVFCASCSTGGGTEEGNAAGGRSDYKSNRNSVRTVEEDEGEDITSLDAFELIVPSTPSTSRTQLGSGSDSDPEYSDSEDEDDQDTNAFTPAASHFPTLNSGEDVEKGYDDDEGVDSQWTLSAPRPYIPSTIDATITFCAYGEEAEPMDSRGHDWETVTLSPTESTPTSGYGSVKDAINALCRNGEEDETMRDWSGCFSSTSSMGSETAMCGDEDDWDQPLWSPVLLSWDGLF